MQNCQLVAHTWQKNDSDKVIENANKDCPTNKRNQREIKIKKVDR